SDEISVRDGMCGLFEFPKIFRKSGHCRRRVEYYLCPVQAQAARAFRKMPVVTDINADSCKCRIETRISQIPRSKIKFFPKTRIDVRDVRLPVLAQIRAVGVYYGG